VAGDFSKTWVRIQKPVVTYYVVSYYRKAVSQDLLATLPNVFADENSIIFTNMYLIVDIFY
jgi:hypothetical protein